jgi:hypothetical protein
MVEAHIEVGLKDLSELLGDRLIGIGLVETEDRLKTDRLKIALYLRLLEWVGVDELAIDPSTVLAERCGGELGDR